VAWLAFYLTYSGLIVVHETGHYVVARLGGVPRGRARIVLWRIPPRVELGDGVRWFGQSGWATLVLLAELVLWAVDLVLSLVATAVLRRPVGDTAALAQ
jgi:hypothetical protein